MGVSPLHQGSQLFHRTLRSADFGALVIDQARIDQIDNAGIGPATPCRSRMISRRDHENGSPPSYVFASLIASRRVARAR